MNELFLKKLPSLIDHTILKASATLHEVDQLIMEAIKHNFIGLCVNPIYVGHCAHQLKDQETAVVTVIDFPLGSGLTANRAAEAAEVVRAGAEEIDIVAHLPWLINMDKAAQLEDLKTIIDAAASIDDNIVVKLIIESAALIKGCDEATAEKRIDIACQCAFESGCDFVKTSTGFHPAGGASVKAVQWMNKHSRGLQIKASGGIRDLATAQAMFEAGAWRLGTSGSVAIMEERNKHLQ